jgi:hypothetical protein
LKMARTEENQRPVDKIGEVNFAKSEHSRSRRERVAGPRGKGKSARKPESPRSGRSTITTVEEGMVRLSLARGRVQGVRPSEWSGRSLPARTSRVAPSARYSSKTRKRWWMCRRSTVTSVGADRQLQFPRSVKRAYPTGISHFENINDKRPPNFKWRSFFIEPVFPVFRVSAGSVHGIPRPGRQR